jgi:hypothetical protein
MDAVVGDPRGDSKVYIRSLLAVHFLALHTHQSSANSQARTKLNKASTDCQ